jgi:peptide/nickel transport system ATP-binding protein
MLFITHNLGVVNRIADRVCVIYAGRIVEIGPKDDVLRAPAHPYTKGLLASLPRLAARDRQQRLAPIGGRFPDLTALPPGCVFAPRCPFVEAKCHEPQALQPSATVIRPAAGRPISCAPPSGRCRKRPKPPPRAQVAKQSDLAAHDLTKKYVLGGYGTLGWTRRFGLPWPAIERPILRAVDDVSFNIPAGEVLGLVGESGSGKSTLARLAIRLIDPDGGEIIFNGQSVGKLRGKALKSFRRAVQIVFQNPDSSLNPSSHRGQGDRESGQASHGHSRP